VKVFRQNSLIHTFREIPVANGIAQNGDLLDIIFVELVIKGRYGLHYDPCLLRITLFQKYQFADNKGDGDCQGDLCDCIFADVVGELFYFLDYELDQLHN